MKRYKYIGTEDQLVEHGFVKDNECSDEHTVWYDKDCLNNPKEIDDVLTVAFKGSHRVRGIFQFNYPERDETEDIAPYIQDLIDDGLVEVVE